MKPGLGLGGRRGDRRPEPSQPASQVGNGALRVPEVEGRRHGADEAVQFGKQRIRLPRGRLVQERREPPQRRVEPREERIPGLGRPRRTVATSAEVLVLIAATARSHAPRRLGALQTETPAGPALPGVTEPRAHPGRIHLHIVGLADANPSPKRAEDPPRPEPLFRDLVRKARRVRGRGDGFRREQPRRVVVAVPVSRRPVEAAHDDERAVEADDADHVLEHRLAVPASKGFVHRLRVAVVDRRREVEVVQTVVAAGEDEFAGPDEAEGVEEFRADRVRPGLAAVEAEQRRPGAPSPTGQGEHAGVLVVRVRGDVEQAGRRGEFADAVPGAHGPAVHVQPFLSDRGGEGEDAIRRPPGGARLRRARWPRERRQRAPQGRRRVRVACERSWIIQGRWVRVRIVPAGGCPGKEALRAGPACRYSNGSHPPPPTPDPMTDPGIQITVEGTPNPHAAKFVLDRDIPGEGSRSYFDPESAAEDPLAARLFQVDGVRALLIVENFITVTKNPALEWPDVLDEIEEAIHEGLG